MNIDENHATCKSGQETTDHLFVECFHSRRIWNAVLQLCTSQRDLGTTMVTCKTERKYFITVVLKLVWNAHVYWIWTQRNSRQFRSQQRSD
ncbi:hypothetical protein PVK06_002596 [Gossypium arboreum]|uniref:Uncharacterized protein n=1 Tax=Gossypium arboreum TaxID=29729 RepID=A0ABR0R3Z6_GOSAR|nr:hypothetical protein PVK06_002596 [Gossypium arboreum]